MTTRNHGPLLLITICTMLWLNTNSGRAQDSAADFHKILGEDVTFNEADLGTLAEGEPVVRSLPVREKKEIAVFGVTSVQVPAEIFLQSFVENMARRSNPAILQVGSFSSRPTLDDMQNLTLENRDIEDLKECVVGDCQVKLSAQMIERFRKEMDWEAPNYQARASQLLKQMLLDYVRDYLTRGDEALIEYSDKTNKTRLANEQHALVADSYMLTRFPQFMKGFARRDLQVVENTLVWSKLKFGLKPVIVINHIIIYKREQPTGPQILIVSKQIYANHYFEASLALTAFVTMMDTSPRSYMLYENRSRADGLEGPFGKIKRGIVEYKALEGLKAVLEQSRIGLNARASSRSDPPQINHAGHIGRRWRIGSLNMFLLIVLIIAFVSLLALSNYESKPALNRGAPDH